MEDIVRQIKESQVNGSIDEKGAYFSKETMISREYFNNEVIGKYPNLVFIRIFMNKTIIIPTIHESMTDEEYYLYSVFIDRSMLEYISGDIPIGELNGEKVIDLSKTRWEKQV